MVFPDDWNLFRDLDVTENSGIEQKSYPLVVQNVDIGTASRDSIRVADANDNLITHSAQGNADGTFDITFKTDLPASTTKNFRIYYGNSSASNVENDWNSVRWNWYDDFTGNYHSLSDYKKQLSGEFSFDNNQLYWENAGQDGNEVSYFSPNQTFSFPILVEKTIADPDGNNTRDYIDFSGNQDFSNQTFFSRLKNDEKFVYDRAGNNSSASASYNTPETVTFKVDPANNQNVLITEGENDLAENETDFTGGDVSYILGNRTKFDRQGYLRYDNLKIRTYTTPEPSKTVGSETPLQAEKLNMPATTAKLETPNPNVSGTGNVKLETPTTKISLTSLAPGLTRLLDIVGDCFAVITSSNRSTLITTKNKFVAMTQHTFTVNDYGDPLKATLKDEDGAIDLRSVDKVTVKIKNRISTTVLNQEVSIIDAENGKVEYQWSKGDAVIETTGVYRGKFKIFNGGQDPESVPNDGFFSVEVEGDA